MSTLTDIGAGALTAIGQLGRGQFMNPEDGALVLRRANLLLDKWSTQRLYLPYVSSRPYALLANTADYTIGPTGATFTEPRPIFIESAQVNVPGSSVWLPLNIIDKSQWDAIRNKGAKADVPDDIYVEYSYPNLGIHVNPMPIAGPTTIKAGVWVPLQRFVALADPLILPPAYEEFLESSLAVMLCPDYDQPITQGLLDRRTDATNSVMKINAQSLGGALGESQKLQSPNVGQPLPSGGGGG